MWVDHQATPIGWVNQQLTWLQFGCVGQATVLQHLQGCGCPLVDGHLAVIHQLLQLLDSWTQENAMALALGALTAKVSS